MANYRKPIQNLVVQREGDFETPSATRQYPLGEQITIQDNSSDTAKPYATTYEYLQAGQALQAYGVFSIKGTGSTIVAGLMTSPATAPGIYRVVVPQTGVTNGYYFWGAVKGVCTMAHTAGAGVNMTAGMNFKIANAATTATVQTVSQSTATAPTAIRGVNSIAFSTGLSATSANINVYLYGDTVIGNYAALN